MTDKRDIELLFKANFNRLHCLAVAMIHDDDIARDIVHEVFASLLTAPDGLIISPSYLVKAVRNRCLNQIRNLEIKQRVTNLYFLDSEEYDSEDWPDEETIARIYQIINDDLTEQERQIIGLRFEKGLKFSNVAKTMGISENAVYKHLRQALKVIRKKLNHNEN
ncbi:MAG: sigma-70 family RNA polymerase sigma factor [Muribaculaceae bacterium]|nr:sigma-70 family RNA polymerase sigma factor [Muribaculaceae bacterium]